MSRQSATWLDGAPCTALPLPDRGLDFGDGLFETLLVHRGVPAHVDLHIARLQQGLKALAINDCRAAVRQQLRQVCGEIASEWRWAALRLSVLRSPGPRGYAPAQGLAPRILITATQLDRDCAEMSVPVALSLADIRLSAQPALARIKHLNRLEQVVAATQAQAEQADEMLLLDQAGFLVSVIAGNLFLLYKGELLTPLLDNCGVAGTRRRLVIERWAPALGLKVREARLTLADVDSAEEVFYSNSLYTVRPVSRFGGRCWRDHSVCSAIFQRYRDEFP